MKIHRSIKAAIATLLLGAAAQAGAGTISIDATDVSGSLNNATYNGSFNAGGLPTGPFTINSIGFSFTFADDENDPFTITSGGESSAQWSDVVYSTVYGKFVATKTITVPKTSTGEQEGVQIFFGSTSFSGQTSLSNPVVPDSIDPHIGAPVASEKVVYAKNGATRECTAEEMAQGNSCKPQTVFAFTETKTVTTATDYTGGFDITGSLLSYETLLAELMSNKSLAFSLGVTGDLNLTGATLNIDYTETPAPANDVPEPASLALFGIALAGIAGIRRARRG